MRLVIAWLLADGGGGKAIACHPVMVVRQASEKAVAVSCKENSLWVVKGLTCLSDGKRTFKR